MFRFAFLKELWHRFLYGTTTGPLGRTTEVGSTYGTERARRYK